MKATSTTDRTNDRTLIGSFGISKLMNPTHDRNHANPEMTSIPYNPQSQSSQPSQYAPHPYPTQPSYPQYNPSQSRYNTPLSPAYPPAGYSDATSSKENSIKKSPKTLNTAFGPISAKTFLRKDWIKWVLFLTMAKVDTDRVNRYYIIFTLIFVLVILMTSTLHCLSILYLSVL